MVGKTTAAGYGGEHQRLRKQWAAVIASGRVRCWRCGLPIQPGAFWDLGHHDWDRTVYVGPEHRSCNRSAGARKKQTMIKIVKTKINKTFVVDRW